MDLMPNESVLIESEAKRLVLTTHRIRYQYESAGSADIKSILLEELASCALVRRSHIALLVLAAIGVATAVLASDSGSNEAALVIGGVFAVVLVVAYFGSRHQILELASAGTTIRVQTQGMKLDTAKQFIERIEAAKNARYLLLARR